MSAHSRLRKGEIGGGESVNLVRVEDHKGLNLAVGLEIRGGTKRYFTGNIGHRRRRGKENCQTKPILSCCVLDDAQWNEGTGINCGWRTEFNFKHFEVSFLQCILIGTACRELDIQNSGSLGRSVS